MNFWERGSTARAEEGKERRQYMNGKVQRR
ncbi:hypothetical protein LINPERHAP1_LOCUS15438 [Linum perenne]